MKRKIVLASLMLSLIICVSAQPAIEWQQSLGGTGSDSSKSIQQTSDGGYIVAGGSNSTDGDVTGNHGGYDFWVVKLSNAGIIIWQQALGGTNDDSARSIQQTNDGGYIVAGYSESNDGDVTGNKGGKDFWVVKLTSMGSIVWQQTYGGTNDESATSILQTLDGGYIVAGESFSNDGDVTGNHGSSDYWIVKLNAAGAIEWQKSLGGSNLDDAYAIVQTTDGSYGVAGITASSDGDVTGHHGDFDYWVVKLTNTGSIVWQRAYGGTGSDGAYSIQKTNDGGFVIPGYSDSTDGDVSGNHGFWDYWIVKLDANGVIDWQKSLGGTNPEFGYSIQQTIDNGYIVAGLSSSTDGDITGNHGSYDAWVVRLNDIGGIIWQQSFGGSDGDSASAIRITSDGDFLFAGSSRSNDGDLTENHGEYDLWVVKLAPEDIGINEISEKSMVNLFPNPTENQVNIQLNSPEATALETATYGIYDYTGKAVLSGKLNNENTQVNLETLSSGIYVVQMRSNEGLMTARFIKE